MLLIEGRAELAHVGLSLELDQNPRGLVQAQARLEFVQAQLERRATRAELAPQARQAGASAGRPRQVVALPAEFLAAEAPGDGSPDDASLLGLAERASRALVPEATARARGGN
jgi:hypothetical protein